jgi:hypothetical protein
VNDKIVTLTYHVPVYVEVNLTTREIEQVMVDDEAGVLDRGAKVYAENGKRPVRPSTVAKAIEIAEDTSIAWPGWVFGS